MNLGLVTLAGAAKTLEYNLLPCDHVAQVEVRHERGVILFNEPWLQLASPGDVVGSLKLELDTPHAPYEAWCKGCRHLYTRTKPASSVHYCQACGPVAGALEFI